MKLVLIEWVDSARPVAEWRYVNDAPNMDIVCCMSVEWVISENKQVLILAPNIGDKNSESKHACGFIRIPKKLLHAEYC